MGITNFEKLYSTYRSISLSMVVSDLELHRIDFSVSGQEILDPTDSGSTILVKSTSLVSSSPLLRENVNLKVL
jgi:hypothetical protein